MHFLHFNKLDRLQQEKLLPQLAGIFFESSSVKTFESTEKKKTFYDKWLGQYLESTPELVHIAMNEGQVLGYLCGHCDSSFASRNFDIGSMKVFDDMYEAYPAHLHINLSPESRGKGIGRFLIERFCEQLRDRACPGLHIITSPDANNSGFYEKLGFKVIKRRAYLEVELLFMGRIL